MQNTPHSNADQLVQSSSRVSNRPKLVSSSVAVLKNPSHAATYTLHWQSYVFPALIFVILVVTPFSLKHLFKKYHTWIETQLEHRRSVETFRDYLSKTAPFVYAFTIAIQGLLPDNIKFEPDHFLKPASLFYVEAVLLYFELDWLARTLEAWKLLVEKSRDTDLFNASQISIDTVRQKIISNLDAINKITQPLIESLADAKEYTEELITTYLIPSLLQALCKILTIYLSDIRNLPRDTKVNALLWIAAPNNYTLAQFARYKSFISPSCTTNKRFKESYPEIMSIAAMANEWICIDEEFLLPVNKDRAQLLPGAPTAYRLGQPSVIDDVHDSNEVVQGAVGCHPEVQNALVDHFSKRHTFETVLSVPLFYSEGHVSKPFGVVNIHTMASGSLSQNNHPDGILLAYIDGICGILSSVYNIWLNLEEGM